jgi:hypothetical protein
MRTFPAFAVIAALVVIGCSGVVPVLPQHGAGGGGGAITGQTGGAATGQGGAGGVSDPGGGTGGLVVVGGSGGLPPLPPGAPCRVGAPLRRLTELQYRNAIRDIFAGQAALTADFALATVGLPESGFSTDPGFNAVDLAVTRELHRSSEAVALSITDKLPAIVSCASSPSQGCAQTFIDQIGRRAYRRPLTDVERQALMRAYALGTGTDAFKDGIAAVASAMLQSAQFLYQVEVGTPAEGEPGILKLTQHELASRLSFLLWDSIPDDRLLDAATAGRLGTAAELRAEAVRMLADARARPTIVRFAREWIRPEVPEPGVDRLDPAYTRALADAMQAELDRFIGDSFLGGATSLEAFLTTDAAFTNTTVRNFYQQNGGTGPRSGLLTQPAFLTGIANPADTSPIRRSVFVRRKLTCEDFPEPPNDAQSVERELQVSPNATARERSAVRNMNLRCKACHSLIDPLGFGFEAFDEIGRYRTTLDDGSPVDARGDFVSPVSPELAGPFETVRDLGRRLAGSPAVQSCMARQLFRFSYGRLDGAADSCAIQGVVERWGTGLDLRELILTTVSADELRYRRVQ